MAANNLRVIYQNLTDIPTTTILASSNASAATATANIKLDTKSLVWRSALSSTTSIKANLVLTFPLNTVRGVILAFTNLSAAATLRVRGYTGNAPTLGGTVDTPTYATTGTLTFDSGTTLANPYQSTGFSNWNADPFFPVNSTTTTYKDRKVYSRVWIPTGTNATSVLIEIVDPNNTNQYVEVSRLIIGNYWTPTYNTSYGLSSTMTDMSSSVRSEAGDLITSAGALYNTVKLDLKYLSTSDRANLNKIINLCGTQKPLFISVFPDNSADWEQEQLFQLYGKQASMFGITHPIYQMYSSQLEIEEI